MEIHMVYLYVDIVVRLPCPTLCATDCSTPGSPSFTISRSLCKLMSIESTMPSNHLTGYI